MGEVMRFPWEQLPAAIEPTQVPAARSAEDNITAIQRDMAYMVTHTAVLVHSNREALSVVVNTRRGQIIPRGECKFTDGTTLEFQDIGMPQVGAPEMTVQDLMAQAWDIARELGLELVP